MKGAAHKTVNLAKISSLRSYSTNTTPVLSQNNSNSSTPLSAKPCTTGMSKVRSSSTSSVMSPSKSKLSVEKLTPILKKIENVPPMNVNILNSSSSSSPNKNIANELIPNEERHSLEQLLHELGERITGLEQKIDDKFDGLKNQLESFLTEKVNDVKRSLEEKLQKIETDFEDKINLINERFVNLEQYKVEGAPSKVDFTCSNEDSTNTRILELERLRHENDLIMNGLIYSEDENLLEIFTKMCKVLNFTDHRNCTNSIFRINNKSGSVIIKFNNNVAKERFFTLYLKHKNLRNSDFGYDNQQRIYLNESLSPHTRFLLNIALRFKKDKWLHRVFTRKGYLFIIKAEGDVPLKITTKSQLLQSNNLNKSTLLNSRSSSQSEDINQIK